MWQRAFDVLFVTPVKGSPGPLTGCTTHMEDGKSPWALNYDVVAARSDFRSIADHVGNASTEGLRGILHRRHEVERRQDVSAQDLIVSHDRSRDRTVQARRSDVEGVLNDELAA